MGHLLYCFYHSCHWLGLKAHCRHGFHHFLYFLKPVSGQVLLILFLSPLSFASHYGRPNSDCHLPHWDQGRCWLLGFHLASHKAWSLPKFPAARSLPLPPSPILTVFALIRSSFLPYLDLISFSKVYHFQHFIGFIILLCLCQLGNTS